MNYLIWRNKMRLNSLKKLIFFLDLHFIIINVLFCFYILSLDSGLLIYYLFLNFFKLLFSIIIMFILKIIIIFFVIPFYDKQNNLILKNIIKYLIYIIYCIIINLILIYLFTDLNNILWM